MTQAETLAAETPDRPVKPALLNGLKLRCPNCGEGPMLYKYLKVHDCCEHCGEELYHHRADDGPAYITILVVGHIIGFALPFMFETWRPSPMMMALTLSFLAVILSLLMLPRIKGMIVAYQWAKRMNGFAQPPMHRA